MKKQVMSPEEIMSFQGTEFTYVFSDGDTMPAYIKKIDLDKNLMSCWSFSLTTDQGYEFKPINDEEEIEGACCVVSPNTLNRIIKTITEIKSTGKLLFKSHPKFFTGCQF